MDATRAGPGGRARPAVGSLLAASAVHPILFAAYFVLFLFAQNLDEQVSVASVIPALALALAGAAAIYLLARLAYRAAGRGGLAATWVIVLFFSYGHVWNLVQETLASEWQLLAAWGVLLAIVLGVLALARRTFRTTTQVLNAVAALLVAVNLLPIVTYQAQVAVAQEADVPGLEIETTGAQNGPPRDVYLLVFDRYAAASTLQELYGYDNGPFLAELERRGFYVAEDSAANYISTILSLASTLSMEYLDTAALRSRAVDDSAGRPIVEMLQAPLAAPAFLKSQGYRYVHIGTWYTPTKTNALADQTLGYGGASEFTSLLYETTALRALGPLVGVGEELSSRDRARVHTLFQLARLEEMATAPGPKFVFAHLALPHDPYVFDREGRYLSDEETRRRSTRQNFVEQIEYANGRILGILDHLLAVPEDERPIILLQADEGPYPVRYALDKEHFSWREATDEELGQKFRILNALHLPGADDTQLYRTISPVNTFRVVFNAYFGTDLPLLEDRVFAFADALHVYDMIDVTERLNGGVAAPRPPPVAAYALDPPRAWPVATTHEYEVTLWNRGRETWQADGEEAVQLGIHFGAHSDVPGDDWATDQRFPLPEDVSPGERIRVPVAVTAPEEGGRFLLGHRIVRGLDWAEERDVVSVVVDDSAAGWQTALAAEFELDPPVSWTPGKTRSYTVTVTNSGATTWGGDIRLAVHFGSESDVPHEGWATDQRFYLGQPVAPGESLLLEVAVTAPPVEGAYELRHRLVKENVAWFDEIHVTSVAVEPPPPPAPPPPVIPVSLRKALVAGLGLPLAAAAFAFAAWRLSSRRRSRTA